MSVILSAKDKILRSSIVEGLYYSLSPKLIFGDDYTKMRRHLQLSEYWDPMIIQNYQKNKLEVANYAFKQLFPTIRLV